MEAITNYPKPLCTGATCRRSGSFKRGTPTTPTSQDIKLPRGIPWTKGDVKAEYEFLDKLSHTSADSSDVVYSVRHRKTDKRFACKRISKHQPDYGGSCKRVGASAGAGWRHEAQMLARCAEHANIVSLHEVIEDAHYVYIVMEECEGGELFDLILERGHLSEKDAAVNARAILEVIRHCHSQGVVNRDLKPENLLLKKKYSCQEVSCTMENLRCVDFGSASQLEPGKQLRDMVGSSFYIAPEVLRGKYGYSADVWSTGVIVYIMLSGLPPFWGPNTRETFDNILTARPRLDGDLWDAVSEAGKDFIRRILDKDPATRMTVSEALAHPWISQELSAPTTQLSSVVLSRLQSFTRTTRLERLLLNVAAHQLTSKEIDRLGAMFRALDHDDDGCITAEDLREGLGAVGKQMDRESIKKLARELDVSGCGSINLEEFIAGAMDRKRALTSETLTRVFSDLDDDHDGELGPRVFASALQVRPCFRIALIEGSCGGEELLSY
ncbi:Pkinase-domain-containing protein [Coccomyxa subellipsoidea C-169]|uniref:Pkinase-domain-containing protein n=1 Tax=Coccomyxa subellipsoidea (strain C-169) TaxID=574566 RepID=I0YTT8_COCSC|nr:Pkinase-domain-containing protein [Coccomyxa subellipsoidea C-169]EIE21807.1 Pkinase-domain-containing protein [Coccomyxa subellipsoidea C-169]|eukprot:XP_005646351.1 Pkinase-domain-containing protein [Coccomyxa subellipsoidea C-169]